MGGRRDRSGFTMLEMLVATALMSLLAAVVYASMHVAFSARDSALASVGAPRKAELALDVICRDLESALPPGGILAGPFSGTNPQGGAASDQDALCLYAAVPNGEPVQVGCDVRRVEWAWTSAGLVRWVTANLLSPVAVQGPAQTICSDVSAFSLRYFDGVTWYDQWDSTAQNNTLPLAVEVTLTVPRPGKGGAPPRAYSMRRVVLLPCSASAGSAGAPTGAGTGTSARNG